MPRKKAELRQSLLVMHSRVAAANEAYYAAIATIRERWLAWEANPSPDDDPLMTAAMTDRDKACAEKRRLERLIGERLEEVQARRAERGRPRCKWDDGVELIEQPEPDVEEEEAEEATDELPLFRGLAS